jgi:membrane associated rhomboid family serine protease
MLPIGDDNSSRRRFPIITYALVIVNVLFFLLELLGGEPFIYNWALVPSRFFSNPFREAINLFTAMFMHAGWMHLGGNMLYLLIFGDNVESRFGHIKFLIFYLISGLAASFAQMLFTPFSDIPILGASGAIAGVLGAYILLFPKRRVRVLFLFRITTLPALVVIGLWFLLQLFSSIGSIASTAQSGGVAYLAHVGGFIAGFIMTLILT